MKEGIRRQLWLSSSVSSDTAMLQICCSFTRGTLLWGTERLVEEENGISKGSHALSMRVWKSHCLQYSEENISCSENKWYQPLMELLFCALIFLSYQILNSGGFWLNSLFPHFSLFFFIFITLSVFSFIPSSCFLAS